MRSGWYYLHTNGELIHKNDLPGVDADFRESDFVRAFWPIDVTDRMGAWRILIESTSLGAKAARIDQLATLWGCDDTDAQIYAGHIGITLQMDGNMWTATGPRFTNLQESPAGFGATCLEAMGELCKALGYKGGKLWGSTFPDLCRGNK
jgi:hypothetical protein